MLQLRREWSLSRGPGRDGWREFWHFAHQSRLRPTPRTGPDTIPMDLTPPFVEIEHRCVQLPDGVSLDCGVHLSPVSIALSSYGSLNAARDNAILVCHALTGDQYVAEPHPLTGKPGWWARMVGPGLPIDTDRYHVLCMNVLGGCMGSTGPRSPRPVSTPPMPA